MAGVRPDGLQPGDAARAPRAGHGRGQRGHPRPRRLPGRPVRRRDPRRGGASRRSHRGLHPLRRVRRRADACAAAPSGPSCPPGRASRAMPCTCACATSSCSTGRVRRTYVCEGFKLLENDPGYDSWSDTTTLFVTIRDGDGPVAIGVLRISPLAFMRELATFRGTGPSLRRRIGRRAPLPEVLPHVPGADVRGPAGERLAAELPAGPGRAAVGAGPAPARRARRTRVRAAAGHLAGALDRAVRGPGPGLPPQPAPPAPPRRTRPAGRILPAGRSCSSPAPACAPRCTTDSRWGHHARRTCYAAAMTCGSRAGAPPSTCLPIPTRWTTPR